MRARPGDTELFTRPHTELAVTYGVTPTIVLQWRAQARRRLGIAPGTWPPLTEDGGLDTLPTRTDTPTEAVATFAQALSAMSGTVAHTPMEAAHRQRLDAIETWTATAETAQAVAHARPRHLYTTDDRAIHGYADFGLTQTDGLRMMPEPIAWEPQFSEEERPAPTPVRRRWHPLLRLATLVFAPARLILWINRQIVRGLMDLAFVLVGFSLEIENLLRWLWRGARANWRRLPWVVQALIVTLLSFGLVVLGAWLFRWGLITIIEGGLPHE